MKKAVTRKLSLALVAIAVTRFAMGAGKMVGASARAALDPCSTTCPAISAVMFAVEVATLLLPPLDEAWELSASPS